MCSRPSKNHVPPQFKCVLKCCYKFLSIVIPSQYANKDTTNTCPEIRFHVYQNVSLFTLYGRRPYKERTPCSMFSTVTISYMTAKLYTRKYLVLL